MKRSAFLTVFLLSVIFFFAFPAAADDESDDSGEETVKFVADVSSAVVSKDHGESFVLSSEDFDFTRVTEKSYVLIRYKLKSSDLPEGTADADGVPLSPPVELIIRRGNEAVSIPPSKYTEKQAKFTYSSIFDAIKTTDFSDVDAFIAADTGLCPIKCTAFGVFNITPDDTQDEQYDTPVTESPAVTDTEDYAGPAETTVYNGPHDEAAVSSVSGSFPPFSTVTEAPSEEDDPLTSTDADYDEYYSDEDTEELRDFEMSIDDEEDAEPDVYVWEGYKIENEKTVGLFITQIVSVIYAVITVVTGVIIIWKKISDSRKR